MFRCQSWAKNAARLNDFFQPQPFSSRTPTEAWTSKASVTGQLRHAERPASGSYDRLTDSPRPNKLPDTSCPNPPSGWAAAGSTFHRCASALLGSARELKRKRAYVNAAPSEAALVG